MENFPDNFQDLIRQITPEIHQNLRRAIELGKWSNGERLSREQVELCLQAVIAYEAGTVDESERTGFIDRGAAKQCRD